MNIKGKHYRTIWLKEGNPKIIQIIDQRFLPHDFIIEDLKTVDDVAKAIKDMHVRGAGLIGATAGYGVYLAVIEAQESDDFEKSFLDSCSKLIATRPTAVNLSWAIKRQKKGIRDAKDKAAYALKIAEEIADEDAEHCRMIGIHGLNIIEEISRRKNGNPVNILTHCNAGGLAFVDYGSATSPIYAAFNKGIKMHIWVDETRPRNQGAKLTAWELLEHGVPHTVISDNTGGHLMQHGMVDLVIVGSDRTTYTGDAANKIGTYLKALAAKDNNVPFYVALPSSSFDWKIRDGIKDIQIEERGPEEVKYIDGLCDGEIKKVLLTPKNSNASNFSFDVTPRRLISGLITERGICHADETSILELFPEHKNDEGYIKFNCNWIYSRPVQIEKLKDINEYRDRLYKIGLIGVKEGIGFGNLSIRWKDHFLITGSATGKYARLDENHYTIVTDYDILKNSLTCKGPIKASSESLSHAVIYGCLPEVNAVIHIHSLKLWEKLLDKAPTTNKKIQYGTPQMAEEIKKILKSSAAKEKIIIMGGHKEGIICFGKDINDAGNIILEKIKKF